MNSRESKTLFEIAHVFVRLNHVARFIVNANHGIVRTATELRVVDRMTDCVRLAVSQAAKWQAIGDYCCDCGFNGRMLMER